jgi:hypothetical protein
VNVFGIDDIKGMLNQTPNGKGIFGNVQFVFDERPKCDYVLIINRIDQKKNVICDPKNIWALMMEPSIDGFFDFTKYGHGQYAKVFTSGVHTKNPKYVKSHIMTNWYFPESYDQVFYHPYGEKQKIISSVASSKSFLPGHKKRFQFIEDLKKLNLGIDFFGRDSNPIKNKWDALYHYKYSIAIENCSTAD